MSTSLAIAATSLALRHLLLEQMQERDAGLGGLNVTVLPPDLARKDPDVTGPQLNLFLYQTSVNAAWRNQDLPTQTRGGELGRPPLALNLHYLLTAYGETDSISHRVLGAAMGVLHDHPLLSREELRDALPGSGVGEQFERLRVTPLPLSVDDLSKLWTALQTQYRVSAGYEVTVVLIDSLGAARAPLPVLRRGAEDRGPMAKAARAPQLEALVYARGQTAARLGETVVLKASQLDLANSTLRFASTRLDQPLTLTPQPGETPDEVRFTLPLPGTAAAADWIAGWYSLAAIAGAAGEPKLITNEVAFALAPHAAFVPVVSVNGDDATLRDVTIDVTSAPRCMAGQRVTLAFGDRPVAAQSPPLPPPSPNPPPRFDPQFVVVGVTPAQGYLLRLRVDGVDSIPVIDSGTPPLPGFDPAQQVDVT